jgi:tetratricopeptide (TPR) repeat protein
MPRNKTRSTRINSGTLAKRARPETSAAGVVSAPTSQQSGREWLRSKWTYAIFPAALAVLVSLNTLWNGWVADDTTQVVTNIPIRKLANIPLSFVTSVWSYATSDSVLTVDTYYRPIFMTLFTINYAIVGLEPWAWHLINVLIHAVATLLVFFLIREVTSRPGIAATTAALFAVHPVHAESVAWVSGITDPLMSLFLLPAVWFYLRFHKTGRKRLFGVVALFYLAALFGKETAVALPLLIAYCELFYFKDDAPLKTRGLRAVLLPALLIIPTAAYFVMRWVALKGALFGSGPRFPLASVLMTIPLAVVKYLKLMALPWGQSYQHYTEFVSSVASKEFLLPLTLVVIIIVAIALARSRLLTFSAVWFILLLAPALAGMRQFDQEYLLQDRYLYLPSIGFCFAVGLILHRLAGSLGKRAVTVIVVVLLAAYSAGDMRQNRKWRDGQTIFENCVETDPNSAEAQVSLGRAYFDAGRIREGEEHAVKALEMAPATPNPYLILSYFARMNGQVDKAIEYLERGITAVKETPITRFKLASIHVNLGLFKVQTKEYEDAERHMLRSLELWRRPTGWLTIGQFYFDQGRFEEALTMFEEARITVPERYSPIHLKLGRTYDKLGRAASARAEYERFVELAPNAPESASVKTRLSKL